MRVHVVPWAGAVVAVLLLTGGSLGTAGTDAEETLADPLDPPFSHPDPLKLAPGLPDGPEHEAELPERPEPPASLRERVPSQDP